MLGTPGLYGHIRRNTLKSGALLAGFAAMIAAYWYAACLLYGAIAEIPVLLTTTEAAPAIVDRLALEAYARALERWYVPAAFVVSWCTIAWIWHSSMIRAATGAHPVSRREAPDLYNLVENLAIAAGLPMPSIEIIETRAMNAYAAGLMPEEATVAVTRGLLETLSRDELEAVLAHEIVHIRNRDVRLMVVALIFAGAVTLIGDAVKHLFRRRNTGFWSDPVVDGETAGGGGFEHAGHGSGFVVAAGIIALLSTVTVAAATLAISHVSALMTRFAISRTRELIADAGAVELTKNPDALISALKRISGHDDVPLASESLRALMISSWCDVEDPVAAFFATHPTIADRIAHLVDHAAGRDVPLKPTDRRRRGQITAPPADAAHRPRGASAFFGRRGALRG